MKSCLILVTNLYPYSLGEAFLEPEVPFLAKQFDKVITLAIGLDKDAELTRTVPKNFDCYNITSIPKKINRAISLFNGAVNFLRPARDVEDEAKKSIKHRLFYEYFTARGEREFALCEKILDKYDFSEYDSVTVYSYWFFVAALVASKIYDKLSAECENVKFVSRAHGHDVYREANPIGYIPKRRFLLDKIDAVYPCSVNGEKYIREGYPEYSDKISHRYLGTVENGTSCMSEDEFHLVSCSRMIPLKRLDRIASALLLLDKENPGKIRWTHIGSGETSEAVKQLCEGLENIKAEFLGEIPNEAVGEFYRTNNVDMLINTSNTEGLPVSMMEAMSFSIPVLATDVGGVGEIVKDSYNGFLIDENFTDELLAQKIKEIILSSKQEREAMRRNARSFWEENFDAEKNFTAFAGEICCS
jgi:glycosyltransferase involved in cell wall biosynthesis